MTTTYYQVPCYILHRRPYRETSAIIDLVVQGHGRLTMVMRSVFDKKKSATSALAQGFRPLLVSFSGHGELKNIQSLDSGGEPLSLQHKYLYSGFYINELLCRLWPQNIDGEDIYQDYQDCLIAIQYAQHDNDTHALEMTLRRFEFQLLTGLGYGIDCFYDCDHNEAIDPQRHYLYMSGQGFHLLVPQYNRDGLGLIFSGATILAMGEMNFADKDTLKAAKRLVRQILTEHLDHRPLKSRELFIDL